MSIHVLGIAGLLVIFVLGTARPINLGALALVMTYLLGTVVASESAAEMFRGFPVDLLVLLVGVTYLFGVATTNGTVDAIVERAATLVQGRRALIPWIAFAVASLPAMAGALGSAGVAMLAPLFLRLAERHDIDRRMVGLMVVHGAAAGNFSPLNVLSAIARQAVAVNGTQLSVLSLFFANLACNVVLAAVIFLSFGGLKLIRGEADHPHTRAPLSTPGRPRVDQMCTIVALIVVSIAAFQFGLNIGFVALAAAVVLHLAFASSSVDADKKIAWSVVLLVCGIVTYVAALQRHGTIDVVGRQLAAVGSPPIAALLICAVAAATSAFASSAAIIGAMIPLAAPLIAQGGIDTTPLVIAIAISATLVDATPFSTVGALVVASSDPLEQPRIYRALLLWGAAMVITAPLVTWLLFILPAS